MTQGGAAANEERDEAEQNREQRVCNQTLEHCPFPICNGRVERQHCANLGQVRLVQTTVRKKIHDIIVDVLNQDRWMSSEGDNYFDFFLIQYHQTRLYKLMYLLSK